MNNLSGILKNATLFTGINDKELSDMLICLGAKQIEFKKSESVIHAGEEVEKLGILLDGRLDVIRDNIDGERTLISVVTPGDIFAESICFMGPDESPVSVIAHLPSTILMLNYKKILQTCPNTCLFHHKLIENMLMILAQKNLSMQKRMIILEQKTVRRKVLALLEYFSTKNSKMIMIPFNREQLANYLCIDRSALSHELSRMREEGLIDYHKSTFKLL